MALPAIHESSSAADDWLERDGMALSLIACALISGAALLATIGGLIPPAQGLAIPVAVFATDLALFNIAPGLARRWARSVRSMVRVLLFPAATFLGTLLLLSSWPPLSMLMFLFAGAFFCVLVMGPFWSRRL
jgi:hypothetical protein